MMLNFRGGFGTNGMDRIRELLSGGDGSVSASPLDEGRGEMNDYVLRQGADTGGFTDSNQSVLGRFQAGGGGGGLRNMLMSLLGGGRGGLAKPAAVGAGGIGDSAPAGVPNYDNAVIADSRGQAPLGSMEGMNMYGRSGGTLQSILSLLGGGGRSQNGMARPFQMGGEMMDRFRAGGGVGGRGMATPPIQSDVNRFM